MRSGWNGQPRWVREVDELNWRVFFFDSNVYRIVERGPTSTCRGGEVGWCRRKILTARAQRAIKKMPRKIRTDVGGFDMMIVG